jgi:hypothetical protein
LIVLVLGLQNANAQSDNIPQWKKDVIAQGLEIDLPNGLPSGCKLDDTKIIEKEHAILVSIKCKSDN